jgi:O-antigen/teichoic acid export membrane protein
LGLILVPLVSLGALRGAMLRGLRKVILGQLSEQIIKPLLFLILILLLPLLGNNLVSAVGVMGAQIIASGIAFCFGLYLFLQSRPAELDGAEPSYKTAIWLKSGIPFALSAALQLINGRTDILVLGIFRTDADIGIYRVAVQMAALVIFGLQAVNATQGPHIAHLYATSDLKRLQKMITRSSQAILVVTVPIVLVIVVFGEFIIRKAFGTEYEAAYIPLLILCVGQLVNASMGSVGSLLNMTGHERDTTKSIFVGAIVNVVLNFSLTPIWGMIGSAVATASTLIVWNLIMWRKVYTRLGIHTSPFYRPSE